MGRPEGKHGEPESAGVESAIPPYAWLGRPPGEWSPVELPGMALQVLLRWPLTWLVVAAGSALVWGFVLALSVPICRSPDPFVPSLVGFFLALAVTGTWIRLGDEALAWGPGASRARAMAPDFSRWLPMFGVALILALSGGVLYLAGLGAFHLTGSRPAGWLVLAGGAVAMFRLGSMALHEILVRGAGPLAALSGSWRLTRSSASGLLLAAVLYGTVAGLCRALLGFVGSATANQLGPVATVPAITLTLLLPVWASLVWTAAYVSARSREEFP